MLDDYTSAPLSERDRALFRLIDKVVADSPGVRMEDLDEARSAGWSDEALYDAITVCALFAFYTRWIDATGVHDLPAAAYDQVGLRLANNGYGSPPQPPPPEL